MTLSAHAFLSRGQGHWFLLLYHKYTAANSKERHTLQHSPLPEGIGYFLPRSWVTVTKVLSFHCGFLLTTRHVGVITAPITLHVDLKPFQYECTGVKRCFPGCDFQISVTFTGRTMFSMLVHVRFGDIEVQWGGGGRYKQNSFLFKWFSTMRLTAHSIKWNNDLVLVNWFPTQLPQSYSLTGVETLNTCTRSAPYI